MFPLVNIKNQLIAIRSLRSPDQRTDHHPVDFGSNLRTQQTDNLQKNAYLFRFPKKDLLLLGQFAAFSFGQGPIHTPVLMINIPSFLWDKMMLLCSDVYYELLKSLSEAINTHC